MFHEDLMSAVLNVLRLVRFLHLDPFTRHLDRLLQLQLSVTRLLVDPLTTPIG